MIELFEYMMFISVRVRRALTCINPSYKNSLIDKQFYHKCFMANRNDLHASGNVTGSLSIEHTYAIKLMAFTTIKVDLLYTHLKLEVPINQ